MEPPSPFQAEAVTVGKVESLALDCSHSTGTRNSAAVWPGMIEGKKVVGYRQEDRVEPESGTETFAEVRLRNCKTGDAQEFPSICGRASASRRICGSRHHL